MSAKNKKSFITVDGINYIYTIRGTRDNIKVIIYHSTQKDPYFTVYFGYVESWGFNMYRPKTIEILIKFYNQNHHKFTKNEFRIIEQPKLFQILLDYFFKENTHMERDRFAECCMRQTISESEK